MSFSPVLSSRKRSLAEMVIEVGEFSLLISFPPLVSLFCVKINVFIDRLSFCQSAVSLLLRNRCFSATLLTLILSSTTEHFSQFSWPHWHLKINSLRNKIRRMKSYFFTEIRLFVMQLFGIFFVRIFLCRFLRANWARKIERKEPFSMHEKMLTRLIGLSVRSFAFNDFWPFPIFSPHQN